MSMDIKQIKEKLKRRPFVSSVYRVLYPSYGTCHCCGLPWSVADPHCVNYKGTSGAGFFAVCDYCFRHETLQKIDEATCKLHLKWLEMGHNETDIEEMIEQTHKEYERTRKL